MGQLFEAVVDYLTEDDWKFNVLKDETALVLSFRGHSGSWQCFATVDEERQWFSFFSILPSNVAEEKRDEICEFIARANYGLVIGNFEMDFDDGEVRYKTSVDVEGGELTPQMIDNLIRTNLMTMDRYYKGLMVVLYSDRDPEEAIAEVESGTLDDEDLDEDDLENMEFDEEDDEETDEEDNGEFNGGPRDEGDKPPDFPPAKE
jgi:hypothetical protein